MALPAELSARTLILADLLLPVNLRVRHGDRDLHGQCTRSLIRDTFVVGTQWSVSGDRVLHHIAITGTETISLMLLPPACEHPG